MCSMGATNLATRSNVGVSEQTTGPSARWLFGHYDYPLAHRAVELVSFAAFCVLSWVVIDDLVRGMFDVVTGSTTWSLAWGLPLVLFAGCAAADLMSGAVHFLFDQFGSTETPVIGKKFVKPFRDHHADPTAMTHGDFIAVNSDNLLISLPVLLVAILAIDLQRHPLLAAFIVALIAAIAMTNQIHKWAHMPTVPLLVRAAQRSGAILSVAHHQGHHRAPFDRHYCITFGRLDVLLDPVTRFVLRHRAARRDLPTRRPD